MSSPSPISTLAPPSLLDPRRRTRSFNGTDSPQVVLLPSLPAIHPPGVDEEHPRMPHPLSPPTAASGSDRDARSISGALRVPGAASALRSVSPMGRRAHPHPLPSPEHDGLAGFAVELVHAAGSNLIHPFLVTRTPAGTAASPAPATSCTGTADSSTAQAGGVPTSPTTAHSLRSLAHQLAGPIVDRQPARKTSGPLELHRETLMALRDQLNSSQAGDVVPAAAGVQRPAANTAATTFPPGLNKRFSAPSFAAKNGV